MKNNLIVRLICSLPVILIVMYFVPFLGICLILFRYFVYNNKRYRIATALVVCGLLILLPKFINYIINLFKITTKTNYLDKILENDIYTKMLGFSKLLIIVGIVLIVLSYIFNIIATKVGRGIKKYFEDEQRKDYEIKKENDLKMQEKREKAKSTHFVKCKYCGADNIINGSHGTCKYCRREIDFKE